MNSDSPNNIFQPGLAPRESKGSLIAAIIVILLIIAGGIYILQSRKSSPPDQIPTDDNGMPIGNLDVSPNDEVKALEADVNAVDLDGLDQDLKQADQELKI